MNQHTSYIIKSYFIDLHIARKTHYQDVAAVDAKQKQDKAIISQDNMFIYNLILIIKQLIKQY